MTNLVGADDYMKGLVMFADPIKAGSLEVDAAFGDEHNALLIVTVEMQAGPMSREGKLRGARLYRFDEKDRIASEQVIFYLVP